MEGQVKSFLQSLGISDEVLSGKHCPCPVCGGVDRFRIFTRDFETSGGCICTRCGPKPDWLEFVQWAKRIDFKEAMTLACQHLGIEGQVAQPDQDNERERVKVLDVEPNESVWTMFESNNRGITRIGVERAGAVYCVNSLGRNCFGFSFYQEGVQSNGGMILMAALDSHLNVGKTADDRVRHKAMRGYGSGLVIPERCIRAIQEGTVKLVIKCEGLTSYLSMISIIPENVWKSGEVVVFTNSGGAKQRPDWMAKYIADIGSKVVIHGDADTPGQEGAELWAREIAQINWDITVVIAKAPGPIQESRGADLRDFINRERDIKACVDVDVNLVKEGRVVEPDRTKQEGEKTPLEKQQEILADIGLEVLCEYEDGRIEVYSHETEKTLKINIGRSKNEELVQLAGAKHMDAVKANAKDIRMAIAACASPLRAEGVLPSTGLWVREDKMVLCSRGMLSVWNGRTLTRHKSAVLDGIGYQFGQNAWLNHDALRESLENTTRESSLEAVGTLVEWVDRWSWESPEVSKRLLAGLIVATMVQHGWPWRPIVAIEGSSNTGKTVFMEMLFGDPGLFPCGSRTDDASVAGLLSRLSKEQIQVGLDEMDQAARGAKNNAMLMEALRSAGRGGARWRSTRSGGFLESQLRHLPWVSGISVPADCEADLNRTLNFKLMRPEPEKRAAWKAPQPGEIRQLGLQLYAAAIHYAHEAFQMASELREMFQGSHVANPRVQESLCVPVAMLAAIQGETADAAFEKAIALAEAYTAEKEDVVANEESVLADIMMLSVTRGSSTRTVATIVQANGGVVASDSDEAWLGECWSQCGVGIKKGMLAILSKKVAPKLDRQADIKMSPKMIDDSLKSLSGVSKRKSHHRLHGGMAYVLLVPIPDVVDEPLEQSIPF